MRISHMVCRYNKIIGKQSLHSLHSLKYQCFECKCRSTHCTFHSSCPPISSKSRLKFYHLTDLLSRLLFEIFMIWSYWWWLPMGENHCTSDFMMRVTHILNEDITIIDLFYYLTYWVICLISGLFFVSNELPLFAYVVVIVYVFKINQ